MSITQQRPPKLNDPEQNRTTIKRASVIVGAIIACVLILVLGLSWYQSYTTASGVQATQTPESTVPAQGGSSGGGDNSASTTPTAVVVPAAPVISTPTHAPVPTSAPQTIPTPSVPTPPAVQPTSPAVQPTSPATSPGKQVTPTAP